MGDPTSGSGSSDNDNDDDDDDVVSSSSSSSNSVSTAPAVSNDSGGGGKGGDSSSSSTSSTSDDDDSGGGGYNPSTDPYSEAGRPGGMNENVVVDYAEPSTSSDIGFGETPQPSNTDSGGGKGGDTSTVSTTSSDNDSSSILQNNASDAFDAAQERNDLGSMAVNLMGQGVDLGSDQAVGSYDPANDPYSEPGRPIETYGDRQWDEIMPDTSGVDFGETPQPSNDDGGGKGGAVTFGEPPDTSGEEPASGTSGSGVDLSLIHI